MRDARLPILSDVRTVLAISLALLAASSDAAGVARRRAVGPSNPPVVSVADDFVLTADAQGWEAGFADYSPAQKDILELDSGIRPGLGFFMSGVNRSDDLFMFITKKVNVHPNQRYEVSFRIVMSSQAGTECAGIGGSPGLSVYVKAGAWHYKPEVVLAADDHYRVNVDIGSQSEGGAAATVAGDIANGSSNCSDDAPFITIERTHRHSFIVQSNAAGEIWLIVGTDSGFEGRTSLYYRQIYATLVPAP